MFTHQHRKIMARIFGQLFVSFWIDRLRDPMSEQSQQSISEVEKFLG
jgi:hypothetical protein